MCIRDSTLTTVPQMVKGWQQEGSYYYYFLDNKGTFATGTQEIDGKTYTFDSQGRYSENGTTDPVPETPSTPTEDLNGKWVLKNGIYYFQKTDGNYATGWQKINGCLLYTSQSKNGRNRMLCDYYLTIQKGFMKMKKILVVALSAVMALSLVSCSNGGDSSSSGEPSNSSISDSQGSESTPSDSSLESSESTPESSESSQDSSLSESTPDAGSEDSTLSPAAE